MLWQKRALAKAGHLSQRCSADSTSSSQTRQRSDSVFPVRLNHRWRLVWCPLQNLTRSVRSASLRVFSLIWFVLAVYKSKKRWWLLGSGLSSRWITVFLVFWSKCRSASCGRVDPRLASESASSLSQRLKCPRTQSMSNLLEQMIVAMDRWRVTMIGSAWRGLPVASTSDLQSQTMTALCQSFSLSSHFKLASSAAFSAE